MSDFLKGGGEDADEWAYNWEIILFRKRVNVMMKIKMLVCLIFIVEVSFAEEITITSDTAQKGIETPVLSPSLVSKGLATAPGENQSCSDTAKKKLLEKSEGLAHPEDENSGSPEFRQCYYLSKGQMRDLYKGSSRSIQWATILGECAEDKDLLAKAARCDAIAYVIAKFENWDLPDYASEEKTITSSNGEMKCKTNGPETIDYAPCVNFVKNHDLFEMGQQTIQTGQNIYYQEKTMSAQADAAKSSETATAGLKVMHDSVKAQQNLMNQRAAMDTTKLMTLVGFYKKIPEYDDVEAICEDYKKVASPLDPNACLNVTKSNSKINFLMNQQGKEKMKGRLIQIGLQAGSNLAMGSLLSKRASDISGVIAKVESFKPIDPLAPSADNLQSTYCQQNPGASKCLTGGLERTFDAMGDNVITFGDGGTGVTFNNTNPYVDPNKNSGSGGSNTTTAGKSVTPVGSVISSAQNNGGLESTAPAAALGKGSAPAGGGGGGGSGGGSGGGGGGGGAPAGQGAGGVAAAIQGKTPTYGGGSGTLSMMGGFGINKAKSTAKDDGNPFGKLFNKETNKNGTLSFGRDPASQKVGDKGENIFDMISKRYSTVNTDKRLLEYEIAK